MRFVIIMAAEHFSEDAHGRCVNQRFKFRVEDPNLFTIQYRIVP